MGELQRSVLFLTHENHQLREQNELLRQMLVGRLPGVNNTTAAGTGTATGIGIGQLPYAPNSGAVIGGGIAGFSPLRANLSETGVGNVSGSGDGGRASLTGQTNFTGGTSLPIVPQMNARLVSPNQTMERGGGITDGLYNPMEHVSMSTVGDSGIPGVGNLGGDNIVGGGDNMGGHNMANPGVSGNRNNLGPALTGLGNVSQ